MESGYVSRPQRITQNMLEGLYFHWNYIRPGSLNAYLLALALVAAGTAARVEMSDWMPGAQFVTLFPAIVISALIGGMAAGYFAVAVSVPCAWYFILPPGLSFALDAGQAVALVAYVMVATLDVLVIGAMRIAMLRAHSLSATLKTVFDSNPDAIIVIERGGRILNANQHAAELFGISVEGLIGSAIESLLPERLRDRHVHHRDDFMRDPRLRTMGIGLELSGRRADGTEFPIDVQIGAIKLEDATYAIATVRDLTRQTVLAQELAESKRQQTILEERARSAEELRLWADAFQCAAIGIEISDPVSGRVRFVNPAHARAHGIGVEEARGMPVADLYAEAERARLPALFDTADRDGHVSFESRHLRKDGSAFRVEIDVASKHDASGAVIYRLTSSRDVTAAKLTEQQLHQAQKMEMVGQLSGGIAHDFNNLLTVMISNAEYLGEQLKSREDLGHVAEDICRAGERGAELAQRLLAFSRRQLLQPQEIDCRELIGSMHKLLRRTLRENIEIKTSFDGGTIRAFADRAQLESAVLNLVLNTQDAMSTGGRLTLGIGLASVDDHYRSLHSEVETGEYAVIAVTDDGEGMTPEIVARAFEPFFTTKDVGKGSGLGLSMVYGFAKQSNGHVSIYSEPGLGTTVRVYVPRVATSTSQPFETIPATEEVVPKGREMILMVEDDPFVRSSVILRVESLGYSVVVAVDGREALLKLRANPAIELLFTDIVMPGGMSGWELAERAHQIRPHLPTVFTSGYALETLVEQGRAPAHSIILTKPYRKAELAHRLREALAASLPVS